jgi:hypothetical protein
VLSGLSAQFDPLGIISPVLLNAKLLMRDIWKKNMSWDEELNEEDQKRWFDIADDYKRINEIIIPRSVIKRGDVILHAFCDASMKAFGAVVYAVQDNKSQFIISKNKLAPMKELSIPKLELTAVLLAARLINYVENTYKDELNITAIHVHTDSQIAVGWIKSSKTLPTYVQNRVDEIKKTVSWIFTIYRDKRKYRRLNHTWSINRTTNQS